MKIAVLGGTFNPLHIGHLFLAEEARLGLGFDKIIFVPTHLPAHKEVAGGISSVDRLAMCEAALASSPHFLVDDCEIRRGGVSYMIDTLQEVEDRYRPTEKIGLLIGDDLIDGFPRWKKAAELARRARLIIVHRNSGPRLAVGFPHEYFDNKLFPLSSSEIRTRVREGRAVRFLIPESVHAYIEDHRLYRN